MKTGARVPDIWLDTSFGPKSKLQSLGIHMERIPCTFLRRQNLLVHLHFNLEFPHRKVNKISKLPVQFM